VIRGKGKQFAVVKKLVKEADEIVIATDAGREGELLARLVLRYAGLKDWKKVKRFWTSLSLTETVVRREFQRLRPVRDFDSLYYAGLARQHGDFIVGTNLTRLATLLFKDKTVWSVGRVQTPVLKLIVDREVERRNFKSTPYAILEGTFGNFKATLNTSSLLKVSDAFKLLSELKKEKKARVVKVERKRKVEPPPLLHSLTTLQREANALYKFSLSKTLWVAQKLYEELKCISYPRTDSQYLGEGNRDLALSILKELLESKVLKETSSLDRKEILERAKKVGKRVFNDAKLTDHHALIPLAPLKGGGKDERRIYHLIARRFVGAFLGNYVYDEVIIKLQLGNYTFTATFKDVIELGWKLLYGEKQNPPPPLKEGDSVTVKSLRVIKKKTQPPPRYTEGSLVETMKKMNLGAPSTRAEIVDTLKERGYVFLSKNSLVPTKKAFRLLELLGSSKVTSPELTGEWEKKLEEIYTRKLGKEGYEKFLEEIKKFVKEEVGRLLRSHEPLPQA
jgi:DNA topoisomerase-3